jgi:hypothetical protein
MKLLIGCFLISYYITFAIFNLNLLTVGYHFYEYLLHIVVSPNIIFLILGIIFIVKRKLSI